MESPKTNPYAAPECEEDPLEESPPATPLDDFLEMPQHLLQIRDVMHIANATWVLVILPFVNIVVLGLTIKHAMNLKDEYPTEF